MGHSQVWRASDSLHSAKRLIWMRTGERWAPCRRLVRIGEHPSSITPNHIGSERTLGSRSKSAGACAQEGNCDSWFPAWRQRGVRHVVFAAWSCLEI
jgi:hypothetical protein